MNTIRRNFSPILAYQLRYHKRLSIRTDYPISVLRNDPSFCYHVVSQIHNGGIPQDSENATFESFQKKIIYRSTINKELGKVYFDDPTSNKEVPRISRSSKLSNSQQPIR